VVKPVAVDEPYGSAAPAARSGRSLEVDIGVVGDDRVPTEVVATEAGAATDEIADGAIHRDAAPYTPHRCVSTSAPIGRTTVTASDSCARTKHARRCRSC
jgi:hypothetical protein